MEKKILIFIKSKPFSRINYYEALRVSLGLLWQKVDIIWSGDGIYSALKDADDSLTRPLLKELPDQEINLYVEKETLEKKGFGEKDILPEATIISNNEISELIEQADASFVY